VIVIFLCRLSRKVSTLDAGEGGIEYADAGLYGSDNAMHIWNGPQHPGRTSHEQGSY
jgi:hypothetical protein